ncbi:GNAT family N-acetyltransferase [Nocardia sp. NPDC056064]|uniref:GNAT family N-acetyltransferase n=1 Tax=Nocardia sp. NPDC056064 TaxID=3345701 RepID=UPI0035D7C4C6
MKPETQKWDVRTARGPVRVTSPAPRAAWNEIVGTDPLAGPSQLPAWSDAVCRSDGWTEASRLYDLPGGRQLVLPLVRRVVAGSPGDPKLLTVQASLPHGWGSGGLVAPGGADVDDVAVVMADLAGGRELRTLLRPGFATAPAWHGAWTVGEANQRVPVRIPVQTHVLDLGGGLSEVWSRRLSSKARTGIRSARRKAESAGLVIEVGSSPGLVEDLYAVYLRWVDRRALQRRMPRRVARIRGMRAEPSRRFHTVAAAFGDRCRIWVARLDGSPIAAAIAVFHGEVGVGWRAFSDRELAGPLRAHELMQFLAVEHACRVGCRYFDMGESGGVTTLTHVKDRLGGTRQELAEYAFERVPLSRFDHGRLALRGYVERRMLAMDHPTERLRP